MLLQSLVLFKNSRKGGLELEQLGKLILGAIFLMILIYIVMFLIGGDLSDQTEELNDVINTVG